MSTVNYLPLRVHSIHYLNNEFKLIAPTKWRPRLETLAEPPSAGRTFSCKT
jgi:hypothetical protein